MLLSALAFACVTYIDGATHCDIRTQYEATLPSLLVCEGEATSFALSLATSAFTSGDVSFISEQNGTCYTSNEQLDNALFDLTNRLTAEGKTFSTTHY